VEKFVNGFYRFSGALWNGFLRFCSTFAWPIGIGGGIAFGALFIAMYWGGAFTPKKTIEQVREETIQQLSEEERQYLATAIVRDAMLTNEPVDVQEGIAWSILNYRKVYKVDIPTIVKNSLTMIPLNYQRKKTLIATSSRYVRWVEASGGQWTAALALADRMVTKGSTALTQQSLSCATHYIRKKRKTHQEEPEALAQLEREMREVSKGTGPNPGEARFFCPK
jgi:hypothetical protein